MQPQESIIVINVTYEKQTQMNYLANFLMYFGNDYFKECVSIIYF